MAGPSRIPFDLSHGVESVSLGEKPPPTLAPLATHAPASAPLASEIANLFGGYVLNNLVLDSLAPAPERLGLLSHRRVVFRDQIAALLEKIESIPDLDSSLAPHVAGHLREDYQNHELLAALRRALMGG